MKNRFAASLRTPKAAYAIIALWFIVVARWFIPIVVDSIKPFEHLSLVIVTLAPFWLIYIADDFRGRPRIVVYFFSAILILPSFFVTALGILGILVGLVIADIPDEIIDDRIIDGEHIVAYRSTSAWPPPHGIRIQQECTVLPGIRTIRNLNSEYPANSVQINRLSTGVLQFTYPPYSERRDEVTIKTARLRKACWGKAV